MPSLVAALLVMLPPQLYVAIGDVNKIVWFPCGIVNEVLTLTDAPDKRSANSVSYLAIDPNGNVRPKVDVCRNLESRGRLNFEEY